jgi:preprotein translocase subunit SecG
MFQTILIFHTMIALGLVSLILMQHGKGADAGAGLSGGTTGSVFGAKGSGDFLFKLTAFLSISFFVTSILLAYVATSSSSSDNSSLTSVMELPITPITK